MKRDSSPKRTGIVLFGATFMDIKGYPLAQYIPAGRNVGKIIQVHGGVVRNVTEDIANVGLRPTLISVVDDSGLSANVLQRLQEHDVNTKYMSAIPDGLGTWLAIFNNAGDVVASISSRPDLSVISTVLDEHGDEIFAGADSVVVEIDMEPDLLEQIFALAHKYHKDIYAVVSNMSLALERRELLRQTGCIVCNQQEAGMFFSENLDEKTPEEICDFLKEKVKSAKLRRMIITLGPQGCVYAQMDGEAGVCPAPKTDVVDTTGAGDSFFAGAAIGLTYGKTLAESCRIGSQLAASVIATRENVCPRFMPEEFGITPPADC